VLARLRLVWCSAICNAVPSATPLLCDEVSWLHGGTLHIHAHTLHHHTHIHYTYSCFDSALCLVGRGAVAARTARQRAAAVCAARVARRASCIARRRAELSSALAVARVASREQHVDGASAACLLSVCGTTPSNERQQQQQRCMRASDRGGSSCCVDETIFNNCVSFSSVSVC
jgi:hypothetical protein